MTWYDEKEALRLEVERLKKELEEIKGGWLKPSTVSERCRSSFDNGLVEGERRAMERARLAFWNNIKEIPFGEHGSTYNSAVKIFVSMFGQHPKEVGLGEDEKRCTEECKEHGHRARCGDAHNDAWYS